MFQPGFDKAVTFTPDSGGTAALLNITGWDVNDATDVVDISHTGTNGEQAFLACLKRTSVTIAANYDGAAPPSSLGIRSGRKATLSVSAGTTATGAPAAQAWSIHIIIESVPYKSIVNGQVSWTFSAKSDAINAAGAVVPSINYPA